MKKDKGNSAKFSEGMGGVSTENNIDTALGSPPPKGEGRAGAKAPERDVPRVVGPSQSRRLRETRRDSSPRRGSQGGRGSMQRYAEKMLKNGMPP